MVELLQNKNSATRFQIMIEIAASGPHVRQKSIAAKLGISPQAVSDYIHQLAKEGLVDTTDRSLFRVNVKGVNWMLKVLRELNDYVSEATQAVTHITVCAAIAADDLDEGQAVGLKMSGGLLVATRTLKGGARGVTVSSVKRGEDVGVSNIEGIVDLTRGKVTILEVPVVQEGGSRRADLKKLKAQLAINRHVGAIGIEALAALRRAGVDPRYLFGVAEAAVEQARCGLSFLVVCSSDAVSGLMKKLQENDIDYDVIA